MEISISVIIPVYNKEKYICQAINSILCQSLQPQEIIIIDDCSTDRSVEIITNFVHIDKRIKLIKLGQNKGVSYARNAGVQLATSKYVTFMDADDFYWNKNKLKNEATLIKLYKKKGLDICAYSQVIHVDNNGNLLTKKLPPNRKYLQGNILKSLLKWVDFSTVPRDYLILRSAILENGGYDESRNQFEDLDLLYRLTSKYYFYCTMQPGTAYRFTGEGLSTDKNGSIDKNLKEVITKNLFLLPQNERNIVKCEREFYKKLFKLKCHLVNILKNHR